MAEQIFISYRRSGGDIYAKSICEALKNRGYTVFYDIDSISGGYFDDRILNAIAACDDFLLVLPPNSLDRCWNEGDWVRLEILEAMKHGKNIIPVLLPGFTFPADLPADIAAVARYNGVSFVMQYFDAVIDAIVKRLTGERVGHAGTLDPEAAGVLPIMVGQSIVSFIFLTVLLDSVLAASGATLSITGAFWLASSFSFAIALSFYN